MNDQTKALQCWLAEIIISPGSLDQKLGKARDLYQAHEQNVIAAGNNIPARSRLNIYTSGYLMRLKECLAADFPMLKKFLGEEVFDQFASAALIYSPSTSYSLYDLGLNFIDFLVNTRPERNELEEDQRSLLELPVDLARIERARQEVLRADGTEKLPYAPISAADLMLDAAQLTVRLPRSVRLLKLKFELKKLLISLQKDEPYEVPEAKTCFLAVVRAEFRLYMHELEAWQYDFLMACGNGVNVYEAAVAVATTAHPIAELLADLWLWLPLAIEQRLLITA